MTFSDFQHRLTEWGHDVIAKGWPGFMAWLGGFTLNDASAIASTFSYTAGGVWFLVQAYFYIKKHRSRK